MSQKKTQGQKKLNDSPGPTRNADTSSKIILDIPEQEMSQMTNIFAKDTSRISPKKGTFPDDIPSPISSPTPLKKKTSDREELRISPHQGVFANRETLEKLRALHRVRGWALVAPFLLSLFIIFQQGEFNARTMYLLLVVAVCVWGFVSIKSLKRNKNILSMALVGVALLVYIYDCCVQFGIIGNEGWPSLQLFQFCFHPHENEKEQKFRESICKGFRFLFYGNLVVYILLFGCLSSFIYANWRLLSLTRYIQSDGTYMVELEDEIDDE